MRLRQKSSFLKWHKTHRQTVLTGNLSAVSVFACLQITLDGGREYGWLFISLAHLMSILKIMMTS